MLHCVLLLQFSIMVVFSLTVRDRGPVNAHNLQYSSSCHNLIMLTMQNTLIRDKENTNDSVPDTVRETYQTGRVLWPLCGRVVHSLCCPYTGRSFVTSCMSTGVLHLLCFFSRPTFHEGLNHFPSSFILRQCFIITLSYPTPRSVLLP